MMRKQGDIPPVSEFMSDSKPLAGILKWEYITQQPAMSILDDLDDEYRLTIFKVGGGERSSSFSRAPAKKG